ncbi:hypothetical protein H6F93_06435 [Leptolyngbya sp. FACHB-671]|nr:hypothetical protein [Leptolyngbya sp. FACHB-671]
MILPRVGNEDGRLRMKEKGDRSLTQATPSPPTDAKRVLLPTPIPCRGGVGDAPAP